MPDTSALYHFTSRHHLPKILSQGITKGAVPWSIDTKGMVGMVAGYQWLTVDPDWQQEWARPSPHSKLTFRRDEYRIGIAIPLGLRERLVTWEQVDAKFHPQSSEYVKTFAGWQYWRLFRGRIPPAWFLSVDQNPVRPDFVITDQN